jgi:hypothetical protein
MTSLFEQRYAAIRTADVQRSKPIILADPRSNSLLVAASQRRDELVLSRIASSIPDQETLDLILADYPEAQARVLDALTEVPGVVLLDGDVGEALERQGQGAAQRLRRQRQEAIVVGAAEAEARAPVVEGEAALGLVLVLVVLEPARGAQHAHLASGVGEGAVGPLLLQVFPHLEENGLEELGGGVAEPLR